MVRDKELTKLRHRIYYLENKQKRYDEMLSGHGHIFRLMIKNKNDKTVNLLNKYHKNKKRFTNELGYLAGLVDGEGYLRVYDCGTVTLMIGMTDRNTIEWIYNTFGGVIYLRKTGSGKSFYVWRMNQGKDLFYLLLLLLPFLINKKEVVKGGLNMLIDKFSKLTHTLYPYKWERE